MALSFTEPMASDERETFNIFQKSLRELIKNLDNIAFTADLSPENEMESPYERTLKRVRAQTSVLEMQFNSFFSDNRKYIKYTIQDYDAIQHIQLANSTLPPSNTEITLDDLSRIFHNIRNLLQFYTTVKDIADKEKVSNELIFNLQQEVEKARETVKQVESAKRALEGIKTEEIYSEASNKFLEAARTYEILFYMLFGGAVLVTIVSLNIFPYSDENLVNFILFKVLTITLVLTLGTLFLRKAAHFRKLHEQAHQTSLELRALPLYLAEVEKSEHSGIYKELVSKYFGKELDKTQHDKIGDLMNEQMKTSLEVFKTSTEIVKSLKPSLVDATSTNPKDPKNTSEN
ncbi:hypothetical protein F3J02_13375 [Acinetobacter sp. Tr-809]|uniref:hypothetical protein n=1 Tax=Acinetobacter sp. Tr-809 TaxID=2608324 RepID=UPI0014211082|nr:hypothetical protein [Acinetobacter sp. Tr-809]NIE97456.1 hypothetical protein [Acinetobacter sp. Tr-809]